MRTGSRGAQRPGGVSVTRRVYHVSCPCHALPVSSLTGRGYVYEVKFFRRHRERIFARRRSMAERGGGFQRRLFVRTITSEPLNLG